MEKVLRRSLLLRNQTLTRRRREDLQKVKQEWRDFNRGKQGTQREIQKLTKAERLARREDWTLAPLAPQRDVGSRKGHYGTVDAILGHPPRLPPRYSGAPKGYGYDAVGSEDKSVFPDGEWRGDGLVGNVVANDRMVVVRGREKGKIAEVKRVDNEAQQVWLKGLNKAEIRSPAGSPANAPKIFTDELPYPMNDVRLVMQAYDRESGLNRDVVVRHVHGAAPYEQREPGSNIPRHTRYVTNTELVIRWPEAEGEREYQRDCDTSRQFVEEITYVPSLDPEWPEGLVDELRNKHARTRKEHDDTDTMKRKIIEDARETWLAERAMLMMPKLRNQRLQEQRALAKQAAKGFNLPSKDIQLILQTQQKHFAGTV